MGRSVGRRQGFSVPVRHTRPIGKVSWHNLSGWPFWSATNQVCACGQILGVPLFRTLGHLVVRTNVGVQYASSAGIMLTCFGSILFFICRFAMMLEDMNITKWEIETGGALECSTADIFLADL